MTLDTQPSADSLRSDFGETLTRLGHTCAGARTLERLLGKALKDILAATGCGSGGIRLIQPDGSLPFYVTENLDPDFFRSEDRCTVEECTCGAVALGAAEGGKGYTSFGSFSTNSLQEHAERLGTSELCMLRGRCILGGYESVAIVPLRSAGPPLGVIYLADRRRGLFGAEKLAFLEAAAALLASAIPRLREMEGPHEGKTAAHTERLLAALSHDLRTPLVPVRGLINFILAEKPGPLTPRQRELLNICQLSLDREIELIENLVESSRLRSGSLQMEWSVFDLRGAIQDAVHYVQPLARERGTQLAINLPSSELPVRGDRRRLLRVFANLLGNAIKYGRARASLEAVAQGAEAVVRVRDDGPGVSEHEREKVFEWLYRGTGAAGKQGSGLGLAIARDVARLHGGRIDIEEAAETTFVVRLPLAAER
jgi:signal transduction histidine kinase